MEPEEKLLTFAAFALSMLFIGVAYAITANERMAKQGYLPMRLLGSTEIYWYKPVGIEANNGKY